jgi:hypothetical protein
VKLNLRYLDIETLPQTGMVDIRIGWASSRRWWMMVSVRGMIRVPVDNVRVDVTDITPKGAIVGISASAPPVAFVRKSTYSIRLIIHPNGGNAMQMVCEECGASYPFSWTLQKFTPCAFCAVRRQSGVRVQFGKWSWEKLIEV